MQVLLELGCKPSARGGWGGAPHGLFDLVLLRVTGLLRGAVRLHPSDLRGDAGPVFPVVPALSAAFPPPMLLLCPPPPPPGAVTWEQGQHSLPKAPALLPPPAPACPRPGPLSVHPCLLPADPPPSSERGFCGSGFWGLSPVPLPPSRGF